MDAFQDSYTVTDLGIVEVEYALYTHYGAQNLLRYDP